MGVGHPRRRRARRCPVHRHARSPRRDRHRSSRVCLRVVHRLAAPRSVAAVPGRDARVGRVLVHVRHARPLGRHRRRQHDRSDDRCAGQLGARRRRGPRGPRPPRRLLASRSCRRPDGAAGRDGGRVGRDRQPADRAARPQPAERDPQQSFPPALGDPRRVDRGTARHRSRAEPRRDAARRCALAQSRRRTDARIDQVRSARPRCRRHRRWRLLLRPVPRRRGVHASVDRPGSREALTACLGQRDAASHGPRPLPARADRARRRSPRSVDARPGHAYLADGAAARVRARCGC